MEPVRLTSTLHRHLLALSLCCLSAAVDAAGTGEYVDLSTKPPEFQAMVLCLEKNMKVYTCEDYGYDYFGRYVSSTVILVPMNSDLITTAVQYKAKSEGLSAEEESRMKARNIGRYVDGDLAAFALLVKNVPLTSNRTSTSWDTKCRVFFRSFGSSTRLMDESGRSYRPTKYTRVFDGNLSGGWNSGYLYFPNFRNQPDLFSYSVHFDGFTVDALAGGENQQPTVADWSFSFDETEVQYLSLIRRGIEEDTIRTNYGITPSAKAGVDILDVLNAFASVLTIIGFFA